MILDNTLITLPYYFLVSLLGVLSSNPFTYNALIWLINIYESSFLDNTHITLLLVRPCIHSIQH